jgi:hypothetical protein
MRFQLVTRECLRLSVFHLLQKRGLKLLLRRMPQTLRERCGV